MYRIIVSALAILSLSSFSFSFALDLVTDGRPQAEIVIDEKPARMTKLAAAELQTYIEKISGAKLPIVTEPGAVPAKIYVGVSPDTERLGLRVDDLKYGAFRMVSGPGWLALLGPDKNYVPAEPWGRSRQPDETERMNRAWDEITGETFWNPRHSTFMYYNPELDIWAFDDRGTLHAVHEFLRSLGVRWYMPGDLGEVVPRKATLTLPEVDRTVRPDFAMRKLWWFQMHAPVSRADALWRLRLGLHEGHDVTGTIQQCHGMKYVHRRAEMRAAHPEYYAIWEGKRATNHKDSGAPCLSSEELFHLHVKFARAVFDHFDEPLLSIDPVDGYSTGLCECDLCKGKGSPERPLAGNMSDYVWGYINRVATELYKTHPDRLVSGIPYGTYRLPPEKIDQLSPNVVLRISPQRAASQDPAAREEFEQLLAAWLEKLPSKTIFTADRVLFNWPRSAESGLPVYYSQAIAAQLRSLKGVAKGESLECYEHSAGQPQAWDAQAVAHLTLYVTTRLWWDVNQDVNTLLEEYYTLFYGPAREQMKAFIEYGEQNWAAMSKDADRIGRAMELLAAAQAAVDPASVCGRRIQLVADYVRPMNDLREQLGRRRVDVPRYRVHPAPALIGKQLNGRLDDEKYWRPVNADLRGLQDDQYPPHGLDTKFRAQWAGDSLYLGIRCSETNMAGMTSSAPQSDAADIHSGDFVEILLETSTHSYYRITVSPTGVIDDADGKDPRWNSGAQAAIYAGTNFWSAEVRIPLAGDGARLDNPLAGIDGRIPSVTYPWYFNVGRQRVREGVVQRFAFSPTGTNDFEVLSRFAELWSR